LAQRSQQKRRRRTTTAEREDIKLCPQVVHAADDGLSACE
jgi:hypothetical protein